MFQPSSQADIHLLRKAVRMWGIQADYISSAGKTVPAKIQTLLQLLQSLSGKEIKSVATLRELIEIPRILKLQRMIEPVHAFRESQKLTIHAYLPIELTKKNQLEVFCRLENGEVVSEAVRHLHHVHKLTPLTLKQKEYSQCYFELSNKFPMGYHHLELRHEGKVLAKSLLMCAPQFKPLTKAPVKKWGAFAPLYGLHREGGLGIGDLKDMEQFQDVVHQQGGAFFGTLPLLALSNEGRSPDPSPYSPVSRLFWNEMYLDVATLAEKSPVAKELMQRAAFVTEAVRLNETDHVDYAASEKNGSSGFGRRVFQFRSKGLGSL